MELNTKNPGSTNCMLDSCGPIKDPSKYRHRDMRVVGWPIGTPIKSTKQRHPKNMIDLMVGIQVHVGKKKNVVYVWDVPWDPRCP